jgi:hypothetical protein
MQKSSSSINLIDLEKLTGLPDLFINALNKYNSEFKESDFLEDLQKNKDIQLLIEQIDDYCNNNLVIGYHYTRAEESEIIENGLLSRTGKEIRKKFINTYGSLFTPKEIKIIRNSWERAFDQDEEKMRDYQINFNFTKYALINGGAEELLKYYGGEQVYNPLYQLPGIRDKLSKIGSPKILKCRLKPTDITTDTEHPWGKIAVSSYHKIQNSNALVTDLTGIITYSLNAIDIEIIKL